MFGKSLLPVQIFSSCASILWIGKIQSKEKVTQSDSGGRPQGNEEATQSNKKTN